MNALALPVPQRLAYLEALLDEGRAAEAADILRAWRVECERHDNQDELAALIAGTRKSVEDLQSKVSN